MGRWTEVLPIPAAAFMESPCRTSTLGCSISLKHTAWLFFFLFLIFFCFPAKNLQKLLNNNEARRDCCLNLKGIKVNREPPAHMISFILYFLH